MRAHQRDTSQIYRLTELTSEIIRSAAGQYFVLELRTYRQSLIDYSGTRWLAHKQTIIDLLVRATYLCLTFGRGAQTLGEEYTDILPYAVRSRRLPSRQVSD